MSSHPLPPFSSVFFCKRLGLTRDGAPEMLIIIIIIIIIVVIIIILDVNVPGREEEFRVGI